MKYRANVYISMLYRYGQRYFAYLFKDLDLEVGQFPAYFRICNAPGISQDGISATTGMDKGTTARSIKQLEDNGMITRETDECDRRVNHIYPTQKAMDMFPKVQDIIENYYEVIYHDLTPEQTDQAVVLLNHMAQNMEEALKSKTNKKSARLRI